MQQDIQGYLDDFAALRNGVPRARPDAEMAYRSLVMRLIGATPIPDLPPPPAKLLRRVEGTIDLPHIDPDEPPHHGIVVFAVGNGGVGTLSDVLSKDGFASAKSLRQDFGADFALLITAGEPPEVLLERAEKQAPPLRAWGHEHPGLWVIGLPELVARADAFLEMTHRAPRPTWRERVANLFRFPEVLPPNPLLIAYGS